MAGRAQVTMLNSMADADIAAAIDRHVGWGLRWLDLKDGIYGKPVIELTDDEARAVRGLADAAGLGISCMSTVLFCGDIESGEPAFCRAHLEPVARAIALASILRPMKVRLLAARTRRRGEIADTTRYILHECPWVIRTYREAIDRIAAAGLAPVIENEVDGCIWPTPAEITGFFAALDRPRARLVWDIQNLWQMGTPDPRCLPAASAADRHGACERRGGSGDGGRLAVEHGVGRRIVARGGNPTSGDCRRGKPDHLLQPIAWPAKEWIRPYRRGRAGHRLPPQPDTGDRVDELPA